MGVRFRIWQGSVFLFLSISGAAAVGCTSAPDEETMESEDELTSETIGVTCKTLGELGSCDAASVCKMTSEPSCKAKAAALSSNPDWAKTCGRMGSRQTCESAWCSWEETTQCVPRTGGPAASASNIAVTCTTLGELDACDRVSACKSASEGACKATASALAADSSWADTCPRTGVNRAACDGLSTVCRWDEAPKCVPRSGNINSEDLGTQCLTFGDLGLCDRVPLCKTLETAMCKAKGSALAANSEWAETCSRVSTMQTCESYWCTWEGVSMCTPLGGPSPGSVVDLARACRSLGETGSCESVPVCTTATTGGSCRARPSAVAADPSWEGQCPRSGVTEQICGQLSTFCTWEAASDCVPRGS
jgi:hypothetical protein